MQATGILFWKASTLRLGLAPTQSTHDEDVIVSLGPSLQFPQPVVLSVSDLRDHVISLAEDSLVRSHHLPALSVETSLPSNMPDPHGTPNSTLHWDAADPVFAPFGRVFPFVPGVEIPLNIKLSDPIPSEIGRWEPTFAAWYRAHKYLFDRNASLSLASHSMMFDHTKIQLDSLGSTFAHASPSAVDYQLLDPDSDAHVDFRSRWDEFLTTCTVAARGAEVVSPSGAASVSPSPTSHPILERWCELQSKSPSALAAQEDLDVKNQVVNQYRLLFGRIAEVNYDDNTTRKAFVPTVLSKEFETFLGMKSGSRATLFLQRALRQFAQGLDLMNAYERTFEFDFRTVQHSFVAALQNFRFLTSSLNLTPEDISSGLCLFHFLAPHPSSVQYQSMLVGNDTILLQEQMGEDKSKIEKKSSKLYHGGRIQSISDFHKALSAWILFSKFAVKDFSYDAMPLCNKLIHQYASVLTRGAPLQWINKHASIPHLPAALLMDANSLLQGCVEVATNFKVLDMLTMGDALSPSLWVTVEKLADATCTNLSNAIYSGSLGPFCDAPLVMDYLTFSTDVPSKSSGVPDRKRSSRDNTPSSSGSDSKRSRQSLSNTPGEPNTTPGLVKWTGPGAETPIPPNLKMMCASTNKEAHLCARWLFFGHSCPHGAHCKLAHLTKVSALSPDGQKQFHQWVQKTKHVEFTRQQNQVVVAQPRAYLPTRPGLSAPSRIIAERGAPLVSEPVPMLMERLPVASPMTAYPPVLASEAELLAPYESLLVQGATSIPPMTKKQRLEWARTTLPSPVFLALQQQYGKDSIARSFKTQHQFRHTWIFLFKRRYLDPSDLRELFSAFPHALVLWRLLRQHEFIDFRPLQAPIPSDLPPETAMHRWSAMFTACLLHYDLHVPTAIRFVGSIHIGAHRDWDALSDLLVRARVEDEVVTNLRRVLVDGSPNTVNAESTDTNYHTFLAYGNHATVLEDVSKTKSTIQKDFMRSYTLTANPLLVFFLADCHLTPIGLVDLNKRYKNPRIIFDSTFRPLPTSMAINDFTSKLTEPPLRFAKSFERFLTWIYNLRLTYPSEEIYICDDDVSGAFRHGKWNPNLVGMHCYRVFGFLFFCTGLTFGDNTSPSQWETIALARQQLAQYFWDRPDTFARVSRYMPPIVKAPSPLTTAVDLFTKIDPDPLHPGALHSDGRRRSPTFDHHVDDNLYAKVALFLEQTVAASVLALYSVLGFPDATRGIRDCVSWEKFENTFSHTRKTVGYIIDSRRMTVSLPDYKRDRLVELLSEILDSPNPKLSIREIAELLGQLGSATNVCRWMRCSYFNLEFFLRQILRAHYFAITMPALRRRKELQLRAQLPADFRHRLESLLSKEMAQVVWNSRR